MHKPGKAMNDLYQELRTLTDNPHVIAAIDTAA